MWQKTIIRRNQELAKRSGMMKHNRWTMDVYKVKISTATDPGVWSASCQCLWVYKERKQFRDERKRCILNLSSSLFQSYFACRCFCSCQRRSTWSTYEDIITFNDLYHKNNLEYLVIGTLVLTSDVSVAKIHNNI